MTLEIKDTSSNLTIGQMAKMGHEQLVFCVDQETGLKAIIAIHDTTLGPALGGTRMWNYQDESEALNDVLRLSRGMTYKASISGLKLGGGKAVIIGDAHIHKSIDLVKKFGEYVDSLGGRYITAKDVGMNTDDMKDIRSVTKHVTGIPKDMGGSGDPSPLTAYGVFMGMKASAKFKWGTDRLKGKKIIVQGVGHVGSELVRQLMNFNPSLIILLDFSELNLFQIIIFLENQKKMLRHTMILEEERENFFMTLCLIRDTDNIAVAIGKRGPKP